MDVNMNKSLAQDKILILYVLSNVKTDVTESDIFKIISPVNNINYFYFKQILADLVDSKLVQTYTKDEDADEKQVLYKLTFDGQNSLNLTIDVLPGLLKLKIDNVLKNELNNEDIISMCFTMTKDLDAVYPAVAVREILDIHDIPMLNYEEKHIQGSLSKCIRVMMYINTEKTKADIKHIYLNNAKNLRKDLINK